MLGPSKMARETAMKRREFITLVGGVAAAWPAHAQQPGKQHRIAFVHSGIPADQLTETAGPFWVRRFYQTMRELGHTEGGTLVVERYSAEGRYDRFSRSRSHRPQPRRHPRKLER